MCRIAGWLSKKETIGIVNILNMLSGMESGGPNAVGIAFWRDGMWKIRKMNRPFSQALLDEKFQGDLLEAAGSTQVLLHTRFATHGSPDNNMNNHPITSDKGMVIHNGIVWYPKKNMYPAKGQTDTEQLLGHIERKGIKKGLATARGSIAIAYVPFQEIGTIWLYRKTSPMVIGKRDGTVVFGSALSLIPKGFTKRVLKDTSLLKVYNGKIIYQQTMEKSHDFYSRTVSSGSNVPDPEKEISFSNWNDWQSYPPRRGRFWIKKTRK